MKRILALLLIVAMLPVPGTFAREVAPTEFSAADYAAVDAMWQSLEQAELAARTQQAERALKQRVDESTAAAVAQAALEHPLYRNGSLRWNGNGQFTFETTVGMTCGYSVRLRNLCLSGSRTDGTETNISAEACNSADVYVIQPYYGIDEDFTRQYQTEGQSIAAATGGTYTLYTQRAATVDAIANAIGQGAVVIFDSHGDTDYYSEYYDPELGEIMEDCTSGATTSYLLLQTGEGITREDYALDGETYHAINFGAYGSMRLYAVDGTCIANHMDKPSEGGLLWMAICLGMATDGLHAPLMEKGVAVTYGYSQSVTFGGDYCWESCFWNEMCKGAEVKDAIARMKARYGNWDYSPQIYAANNWERDDWVCASLRDAIVQRAAFPIVVSREDVYPGQGRVDDYQDVRSSWKLPRTEYLLTTSANDDSLGAVSLAGNVVTAQPKEPAAYIGGYTLTPADGAKVNWEGNTFTVTEMTADCHLTVNFVPRREAVVNFAVPEGCQPFSQSGYVGVEMPLSAPEGSPIADGEDYRFVGWTAAELTDSLEAPEYLTACFVPTESETTLYALYCYEDRTGLYYTTVLRMKICYAEAYTDADLNAWYHEALDFVLEEGYMNGTGAGIIEPEGKLTRAMLATILYRMSGDAETHNHPFSDVKADEWYAKAIAWAYETGVVTGTSATTFDPNGFVTREQTATMFYRYAKRIGQETEADGNLGTFRDASLISDYAKVPLRWAVGKGIINGKGDGILDPAGTATRAEIAKIIYYWIG